MKKSSILPILLVVFLFTSSSVSAFSLDSIFEMISDFINSLTGGSDSTPTQPVCNPPYMQLGSTCCLDSNSNGVCDTDDTTTTTTKATTTTKKPATTIQPTTTTSSTTTILVDAVCNKDADCGSKTYRCEEYFCKDGSVYRKCRIDACHNPGKPDAFCSPATRDVLIDECDKKEDCVDGKSSCQGTGKCGYTVYAAPDETEKMEITGEFDEELMGYQFKVRTRQLDDNGCIERLYLQTKAPSGIISDTQATWENNGLFVRDDIRIGIIRYIDDDTMKVWLDFPCRLQGIRESGSSTLIIDENQFKGWGDYTFKMKSIQYDSNSCPESIKVQVQKDEKNLITVNPTFTMPDAIQDSDNTMVGLIRITGGNGAEIWIKEMS